MTRGARLVAVLVAVLTVAVALPTASMSFRHGAVPAETSAKKKKKKKCRKGYKKVRVHGKVKCKKKAAQTPSSTPSPTPTTQDPRTRFLAMFNNSGFDRPVTTNTTPPQFGEDLYNFCANGAFVNRYTAPLSGTDYTTHGSWQLMDVKTGTLLGLNIVEGYVVTSGTDNYGDPKQSNLYIDLSEQAPNVAYINQNEFTRVAPQAC